MKKVLIWGIGKYYQANRNKIREDIEIVGFVDNNIAVQGTYIDGKPVYSPDLIPDLKYDFIFVLCKKYPEVRKQLMGMDLRKDAVVYDVTQIEMLCDLPPVQYFISSEKEKHHNNLVIFSYSLAATGAQNIMLILADYIRERYNVTVVSKSDGVVRERLQQIGVSVVITADFRLENEAVRKEIAKADLILVNTIWLGYLVDSLRKTNKKVIWWLHESAMLSYIDRESIRRCLLADNIHTYAVSNIVIDYIETQCDMPGSIKLFPIGVPEYESAETKRSYDKTVFAIIGGLNHIKGQDTFVKAVSMIPNEKRSRAEFRIIGGGSLDEETKTMVNAIPEIRIIGEVDNRDMPQVYSDLDVVVCCSREESMSITVMEGFMNRKNSIVSDRAGINDYISDGINGFTVECENANQYAEKMEWIIDHRKESAEMGEKSRELYDKYFSETDFYNNVDKVVNEVLKDQNTKPEVSVIMPIYNAEKYVRKTIECILSQTFRDFELIVIDDQPTDSTLEIVESIRDDRIRIIHNKKNMGIAASRNHGLDEARGKYIALMDDDDLCPPYRFQCEYDFLEQNPNIDAVGGGFRIINENDEFVSGVTPTLQNPGYVRAQLMFYCTMYNGSTMFRKNIVDEHHIRYLDNYLGMEDYRFWVEYARYGKMTNATDALLYWRQAPSTETIKVLSNKVEEREKRFAGIQRYAIESQGFDLSEDEIKLFTDSFMEHKKKQENKESLNVIYSLFSKMIHQAKEKGMDNAKEIMQACRNRFLEKVKESNIWE